jgi:hypothetical protein
MAGEKVSFVAFRGIERGRRTRRTLTTDNASKIFILKPIEVKSTGRGKHPFKVKGRVLGTARQHTYPLRIHGKNPEISKSYVNGIFEEYNLPDDVFTK